VHLVKPKPAEAELSNVLLTILIRLKYFTFSSVLSVEDRTSQDGYR